MGRQVDKAGGREELVAQGRRAARARGSRHRRRCCEEVEVKEGVWRVAVSVSVSVSVRVRVRVFDAVVLGGAPSP